MSKFNVGDKVLCSYRLPTAHQFWLHEVHVGTVEAAGTDPKTWNGHNSEADYCASCKVLRINYGTFTQHDSVDSLVPAPQSAPFMLQTQDEAEALVAYVQANASRYHN